MNYRHITIRAAWLFLHFDIYRASSVYISLFAYTAIYTKTHKRHQVFKARDFLQVPTAAGFYWSAAAVVLSVMGIIIRKPRKGNIKVATRMGKKNMEGQFIKKNIFAQYIVHLYLNL